MQIVIPYKPREQQKLIHNDQTRFKVIVCHRRFGKTVAAINELGKASLTCENQNPRYAYIAPLYKQAKSIAWDYIQHFFGNIPDMKFNQSELRADFPNGARITLYGADNPDSLRGIYLDGVVMDEVAQMPPRMWSEIIRPTLADRKGWAWFIGTPCGKNMFYDMYNRAADMAGWCNYMFKASDTGLIDPEEIEQVQKEMTEDEFNQEFECSFEAAIKGAYYAKWLLQADKEKRITSVPYDPILKVNTWWDLGVSDSTSIWFTQTYGGAIRVIDYFEDSGEGLPYYFSVLEGKGYNYGQHYAPHDIQVRELGSGQSRIETARKMGLNFLVVDNLPIQDGIQAVRNILPKVWIDKDKCADGLEALRQYKADWDDKKQVFRNQPLHDWTSHAADAFRYFAVGHRDNIQTQSRGKVHVAKPWRVY